MEATNVNLIKAKVSKVQNKFGTAAYSLIVIGSFLPAVTLKTWGMSNSMTGIDAYGFFVVVLMFLGAASCALGLPKIISKGIGGLLLLYLYYHFFNFMGDVNDMAQMFGGIKGSNFDGLIELVAQAAGIGIFVLLTGFVMLNLFMFKSYVLHPRFEALETLLKHYSALVSEKAVKKSVEIKKATEEKAAQVKKATEEKAAQVKKATEEKVAQVEKASKEKATEEETAEKKD